MRNPDPVTQRIWARADRYTAGGNSCKYIVVHNTANTAPAVNEARNLANNYAAGSFHYVIDDGDIIQCVHDYDTAWAVGAWTGARQLIGNKQSISIEVCNPGTQFSQASIENLRKLVLHLMEYYGIPADHVVRHWDCHTGRKQCPKFYSGASNQAWTELHAYITGQVSGAPVPPTPIRIDEVENAVYRLYNPTSGDHLFTASHGEAEAVGGYGWTYEGVAWYLGDGDPVWRFCNPNDGTHMLTSSHSEHDSMLRAGWTCEGEAFGQGSKVDVQRLYNPVNGLHMFTVSGDEVSGLIAAGWTHEGVAFKAN